MQAQQAQWVTEPHDGQEIGIGPEMKVWQFRDSRTLNRFIKSFFKAVQAIDCILLLEDLNILQLMYIIYVIFY